MADTSTIKTVYRGSRDELQDQMNKLEEELGASKLRIGTLLNEAAKLKEDIRTFKMQVDILLLSPANMWMYAEDWRYSYEELRRDVNYLVCEKFTFGKKERPALLVLSGDLLIGRMRQVPDKILGFAELKKDVLPK